MNTIWWTLVVAALAADPEPEGTEQSAPDEAAPAEDAPPADAPAPPADATPDADEPEEELDEEEQFAMEILVISEAAVKDSRDAVVRAMEDLGWKAKRRRNGQILFKGPEGWMGKAHLYESGDIVFTTPAIALNGPRQTGGNDGVQRGFDNDAQTGTVGISVAPLPSGKKVRAAQADIREKVQPLVLDYRDKIQKRHFARQVGELPARLDAVWETGEGMDGSVRETPAERRQDVLAYWASRLDSPEGRVISRTIESWLRNVVQTSDHPVTAEEKAAAEADRQDGRPLDI
jgi:hypothetical protein